jgi:hypothetical protein
MKHCALVLPLAVLVLQPARTITDRSDYAVYDVVIASDWLVRVAHATELLIQDTTEVSTPMAQGQACFPSGPDLIGPWAEALTTLKEQNATSQTLTRQFTLPVGYRLESKEQIVSSFQPASGNGWAVFNARYPNAKGFLSVSAVGFDKAHQVAIVYVAHSCGWLCGSGGYQFLWREPDHWTRVRLNANDCNWVS